MTHNKDELLRPLRIANTIDSLEPNLHTGL